MALKQRNKIFLSWSGDKSKACAELFLRFLSKCVEKQFVFFSQRNLRGGDEWRQRLSEELQQSLIVIAFLTKENINDSSWITSETASVYFANEDTKIFPILIDLKESEIPTNSPWNNGPFALIQFTALETYSLINMLRDIQELFSENWKEIKNHTTEIGNIIDSIESNDKLNVSSYKTGKNNVIRAFQDNDSKFTDWAYQYHRIIHVARDLVVRNFYDSKSESVKNSEQALNLIWNKEFPKRRTALMVKYQLEIDHMLNLVEKLFKDLIYESNAKIWVCLRDLRGDGCYHNFNRSAGFPTEKRNDVTTPWEKDCEAIKKLILTTGPFGLNGEDYEETDGKTSTGQNCTLITNESQNYWPPVMKGVIDPHRKESILGAVFLKEIKDPDKGAEQGVLWWVLCINSDTRGTFDEVHRKILQGCNDIFSTVANTIIHSATQELNRTANEQNK